MPPEKSEGRRFTRRGLLRWLVRGGALALGGSTLLSLFGERHWPRVYRVTVPLPGLPAPLDGFTICQLSDLHRGPIVSEEFLRKAADLAASLKPDLVALTGDYVSTSAGYAPSCAQALSSLKAPYGVYAVLGNHEYWTRPETVTAALQAIGVRVLVNRSVCLRVRGVPLWLCGLDDVWSGSPDLEATLRGVPTGDLRILLCHEPDFADEAAARGIPLQLSGHTHGGQVVLPLTGPPVLPPYGRKYPAGLRRVPGSSTLVYTNVGLGVVMPAFRFHCRPEVSLLTLRSASG